MNAIDILKPFIENYYGDETQDPAARLQAYRHVLNGDLPEDYAATLLWLRSTAGLIDNNILSIEPPRPREFGIFEHVGPNPPIDMIYGLQNNHYNVFNIWRMIAFRLPAGLIPIADSCAPSLICLDISKAGFGRVYHWFHLGDPGPDDENGRPGRGNTFLLANSFTDLCQRLRPIAPLH